MTKKKRNLAHSQLVVFAACLLFFPATTKSDDGNSILDALDLALERSDHKNGPALSAAVNDPNYWESYNQWMCFSPDQVQFESIGIKYDGWKQMPQITVNALGQVIEVSPEADLKFDTPKILEKWRELMDGSKQICLYAAFLKYMNLDEDAQEEENEDEPYDTESYSECHRLERAIQ